MMSEESKLAYLFSLKAYSVTASDIFRLFNKQPIKNAEGKRITEKLPERARVVALDLRGKNLTSEAFAADIDETMTYGTSQMAFIIGGSNGLSDEVLQKTDIKIYFGKMTYPHQLMRLILVEQVYRAFKIMRNEPYHK